MTAPNARSRPVKGGSEPMLAGGGSDDRYTSEGVAASDSSPFSSASEAAWAVLDAVRAGRVTVTRRAGSFLGETAVDASPLTERQRQWLETLLERASLPSLAGGAA